MAKASLLDALYGREDVENRNGSLNNTIFRLCKQLLGAGLPKDNYITITGGMCYWTGKIPVEVDCLEFENRIEAGDQTDDPVEKIELYEQACHIYTGEFLPDMIGEDWAAVQNFNKCSKNSPTSSGGEMNCTSEHVCSRKSYDTERTLVLIALM